MKKIAFLLIGISLTVGAMAQTDPHKKADMQNLRTDVREKKAASHKVNKDLSHVRVKKAIHDHKAVARQNKDIRQDSKALKNRGVKSPGGKGETAGKSAG